MSTIMNRLIVNADDYGICESVNAGIIDCFVQGLVSDLSFIINPACFTASVAALKGAGINEAGIHFNLTMGKPNRNGSNSLTDQQGRFSDAKALFKHYLIGKLKDDEIYLELKCQLDKILAEGLIVSHFDSHQNVHLIPQIFRQLIRLGKEYNLNVPIRVPFEKVIRPTKVRFSNLKRILALNFLSMLTRHDQQETRTVRTIGGDFFNNPQPAEVFEQIIRGMDGPGNPIYELAVHPGYYSDEILQFDQYARERETELQFLKSIHKKDLAERVQITSFSKLN
jgi:predicted glycoside hydrolase/deacetylase ChbG (UPF0249 family)